MKQDKNSEGYISNKYLRELVVKFNSMNINDNGKWCDAYERKMDKKNANGNIKIDKYEISKSFIQRKKQQIAAMKQVQKFSRIIPELSWQNIPDGGNPVFQRR